MGVRDTVFSLSVKNLSKRFGPRRVLEAISFDLSEGDSLAIVGRNGSGKTTLLRIVAGLMPATAGKVAFGKDSETLSRAVIRDNLAYVGPEMALYEPLTAYENLSFFAAMRGVAIDRAAAESHLEAVGLEGRGGDLYGAYSSGMKQRLKYAVALMNDPAFLLLDEPTANLDERGKELVAAIIARQKTRGILLVATNEKEEYGFARSIHRLDG